MTLAWVAAATASPWAMAQAETAPDAAQPVSWPSIALPPISAPGYGTDPSLTHPVVPWPLTLSEKQRADLKVIAGLILPADSRSPSAASLPIDAFVDEWISAPYPVQARDRVLILSGLAWLDGESTRRFGQDFTGASEAQRRAIFDDIAFKKRVTPGHERPALFFTRLRNLVMVGFYSLPEGFADIGYIGNTPSLAVYPGPTPQALAHFHAAMAKLGLKT